MDRLGHPSGNWSQALLVLICGVLIAVLSGCLMLAIPSAGYEAYKYEHGKSSKTPQASSTAVPPPGMTE
ncbi:MAG TPA: hypothetical protein VKV28_09970 [Candidatus Binataceae bacterium]|nr:hypothetical protein [Candidatus Binataceae bacterium]